MSVGREGPVPLNGREYLSSAGIINVPANHNTL